MILLTFTLCLAHKANAQCEYESRYFTTMIECHKHGKMQAEYLTTSEGLYVVIFAGWYCTKGTDV